VTEPDPSEQSLLPTLIAGYRIVRVLGGGGMSTVYLATSPAVPYEVALKVLPVEMARNPGIRTRFVQEGDTTARLRHPNVVAIYGRGETEDGQLWIAMQYVKGTDAEAALQAGSMTPVRALRIVGEVAAVLDYAHRCGVVHQDVKPSNILLGERAPDQERVLLSDFGAALTAQSSDPADSPMVASVAYAAPEVIMGHPVDGRADVYSLGCTLFRLLTDRYPFPGDGGIAATITAHFEQPPPTLSDVLPWAGPELDEVIAAALAKDPAQRFATAGAFAAASAKALHSRSAAPLPRIGPAATDPPRTVSAPIRPRLRPVASSRRRVAVAGAAAAVLLAVALVVWLAVHTPTPAPTPTADSPTTTTTAPNGDFARLRALLPPGYSAGSCVPSSTASGAEAVLSCGPNLDPGGPTTATYTLADSPEKLQAQFQRVISAANGVVCPGNIQSPGPWRHLATPNVIQGTVFCGIGDGRPLVAWTNDSELLLASTQSENTTGPGMDQLYTWWSSHS
jgi:eukaryotic-like serine/threonine-protein kinase